ncbi:hypothetical protein OCU04_008093 [Sclerotinia nivalis]|uniref:Uncharacterized protein n=1 Tax=Sclerotinia nivalis TaxID=352851 RepID=A0A9X0DJB0_9HELO|nr:hypothetical protein OCU04_008093 [Sclerotinia nivalis]
MDFSRKLNRIAIKPRVISRMNPVFLQTDSQLYNDLPDDSQQPEISETHLQALSQLFVRHSVQDIFGLHLIHGHSQAPSETVMFGVEFTALDKLNGCWTKPQPIPALVNRPIHGHIFRLRLDGACCPYEFRDGQADPKANSIQSSFFQAFADYLKDNRLADLLGLELLDRPEDQRSLEFVLGVQGTVMPGKQDFITAFPYRITSWTFQAEVGGIVSCKGGTVHAAKKKDGKHQVFIDSKPLQQLTLLLWLFVKRVLLLELRQRKRLCGGIAN